MAGAGACAGGGTAAGIKAGASDGAAAGVAEPELPSSWFLALPICRILAMSCAWKSPPPKGEAIGEPPAGPEAPVLTALVAEVPALATMGALSSFVSVFFRFAFEKLRMAPSSWFLGSAPPPLTAPPAGRVVPLAPGGGGGTPPAEEAEGGGGGGGNLEMIDVGCIKYSMSQGQKHPALHREH